MYSGLLSDAEHAFLKAVSGLAYSNPFLPEHTGFEKDALGESFAPGEPLWSMNVDDPERPRANVWRVAEKLHGLAEALRERLRSGVRFRSGEMALYEDGVLRLLYHRFYPRLRQARSQTSQGRWGFYREFLADWNHFFGGVEGAAGLAPGHVFAIFHQLQRAFDEIFESIIGSSLPAARLRASIWQSVFTHDMRLYQTALFGRMGQFATLITGPSGTGKELAARAIARSRYLPFDDRALEFSPEQLFYPINISALSPTLVESELFGHRRGSFTGAVADRKGWLEMCPEPGSVFLDELGDMNLEIQVKLLRVIETRTFHPVGDTASREFRGKLIASTNRDLAAMTAKSEFREDLYYRLCSDQITTPSLAEQIADSPQVLEELILYMTRRVAGDAAETLARSVIEWVQRNLGTGYAWPGNYRELDQCVKNILIRHDYKPLRAPPAEALNQAAQAAADFTAGRLTAEELLSRYCTLVYRQTGSYEETARRVGLDRRTVKSKVDRELLARL
jgi:transcriptional regulator with AAA-type ATPase domain